MYNIIVRNSKGQPFSTTFVDKPHCTLGSLVDNAVVLPGWKVARVHAELQLRADGVYITNRAKMMALRVNDNKVESFGPLTLGDTVNIGDYQIKVQIKRSGDRHSPEASLQLLEQHRRLRERLYRGIAAALATHPNAMTDNEIYNAVRQLIDQGFEQFGELPEGFDRKRVSRAILAEFVGMGPLDALMTMNEVSEIMVNAHDEIFYQTDEGTQRAAESFTNDEALLNVIRRIVKQTGRRIDERFPMVDARIEGGARINAIIPPLAIKGPSLTIRRRKTEKLTASHLINYQSSSPAMVKFLEMAVKNKRNIVISGGTGSGKSTLLNILSNFIPEHERIVTIEDAPELELLQPNLVALETRATDSEGHTAISVRDLVRNSLRMSPDRIVVGECRSGEALDMLQAMNTGHDGSLTTIHANSPRDCINRMEVLVLMSGLDMPVSAIRGQIQSGVHLIIQQMRFPCGSRKITSISEVCGMESNIVQLGEIFRFQQDGHDADGKVRGRFLATGLIPMFVERLKQQGTPIDYSIFE